MIIIGLLRRQTRAMRASQPGPEPPAAARCLRGEDPYEGKSLIISTT